MCLLLVVIPTKEGIPVLTSMDLMAEISRSDSHDMRHRKAWKLSSKTFAMQ